MNSAALHDYLDCLSRSVFYAEEEDMTAAEAMRAEASAAAAEAFPAGSDESHAAGVLLAAAGRVPEEAA